MGKRIATFVLGCWTLPAWAQEAPTERVPNQGIELRDLAYASHAIEGFLVVVIDHDNTLQGQAPSGEFGLVQPLQTLTFRDDGVYPDGVAGDFQYVALSSIPETVQGQAQFRTTRADGTVLWDEVIPMPWENPLPWVALELFADSPVKSTVMTNDHENEYGGGPGQTGSGESEGLTGNAQRSSDSSGSMAGAADTNSDGRADSGPPIGVLLAVLLGVPLLVWAATFRRVRARQLHPVGAPKTLNPARSEAVSVWVLPDERQRLDCIVHLARARHHEGRVLLCPRGESRTRLSAALSGISGVVWSQLECPSVGQIVMMVEELRGWGRPLILVEGPSALESPDDGEIAEGVLKELIEACDDQLDVLILMTSQESTGDLATRVLQSEDWESLGLLGGEQLD